MFKAVTLQVVEKAKLAVSEPPLWTGVAAHAYCKGEVFSSSKELIERRRIPEEKRGALHAALADVDAILVASYYTADREPEPLAGGGKLYLFFIQPDSFAIL
jgi:hypothetical protein